MKVLIISAIALTASSAMALDTTMVLKGRFDYVRTETENTPGSKDSTGKLTTDFLRLGTNAKFNESTSGKLVLDLSKDGATDNGVSNLVDEAFITKTMGDFSFMAGKQAVMTGGRENETSSRDLYLESNFKKGIVDNLTGLTAGYSIAGQNVYLQYLQQEDTKSTTFSDRKVLGLAYYGEFMDKMIMPIVSYHKQGTNRAGAYDVLSSVGLRVNVANFVIEADYLMLEQEKLTAGNDAELNTMVAHVRYVHENFQPFAKFIKEEGKKGYSMNNVTGATESERTAWELGLEYAPNKDEDMRYHLVYNSSESKKKTPAPTAKYEEQKIIAGVAFGFNVLK